MARCTAPVRGHHTASGRATCPACGGRYRGFGGYGSYSFPAYLLVGEQRERADQRKRPGSIGKAALVASRFVRRVHACRGAGAHPGSPKRREASVRCLTFGTSSFVTRGTTGKGAAKELHDLLESLGVSVWFSEKDVASGTPLLREIDRGLAKSRVGIVLVTPLLLRRLPAEGIADKELSALLARDLLVPVVHDSTYEALSRSQPPAWLAERP